MLNIKKIRPMFNQVVCTMNEYTEEELKQGSIIDIKKIRNSIKEYQKVVAVGPVVRNIQVGDLVMINPRRYAKPEYKEGSLKDGVISHNQVMKYAFPTIELNGVPHLLLSDQDIDFVIEEYIEETPEENTKKSDLYIPKKEIIC